MKTSLKTKVGRRRFLAATVVSTSGALAVAVDKKPITQASVPGDPSAPEEQAGTVPSSPPFDAPIQFTRQEAPLRVKPFALTQVRLLPSAFLDAQEANRSLLHRYSADRLLHNFRVNAGLPSSAEPLGGWEKPDCELRGHFVGHYLSACALMHAATGDAELKSKAQYMVGELAKCQERLGGGYLSAFPVELFTRLNNRKHVWAPFYTYHKILAGMLDVHEHCGNAQALTVAEGMARWVDQWTAAVSPEHMQMVLDEEFGGMNEALYNLSAFTANPQYASVGDRFTKKRFFNPLALRQDRLRGLHTNTHIPQVIGAARRYELSSDRRFYEVADAFWTEVAETRTYVTGGTSNNEGWLTDPNHLAEELTRGTDSNECCCVYNMLKLTRKLYTWSGDPRLFDYYERILYNHRLGTIDTSNGHTQYYLGVVPGSWRTFATEDGSFWCCTGTGVEEYSKLADSIYFTDGKDSLYVNLLIPSELNWAERGIRIRQTNQFPVRPETHIEIEGQTPPTFTLHIRIPSWVQTQASVFINDKESEVSAAGGSYLVLQRRWHPGDVVRVTFPMQVQVERMPDDPKLQAFLYGPLVLAARISATKVPESFVVGRQGPDFKKQGPAAVPTLHAKDKAPESWKRVSEEHLQFEGARSESRWSLVPFHSIGAGERYTFYWKVV
ncbi:MAG: glycoside hydrolase family 127 protein [Acidobacteriaceae bacterium]|nr:glycoside hydrolase family 127 protein [Acidobacteriaceae bacterium]